MIVSLRENARLPGSAGQATTTLGPPQRFRVCSLSARSTKQAKRPTNHSSANSFSHLWLKHEGAQHLRISAGYRLQSLRSQTTIPDPAHFSKNFPTLYSPQNIFEIAQATPSLVCHQCLVVSPYAMLQRRGEASVRGFGGGGKLILAFFLLFYGGCKV